MPSPRKHDTNAERQAAYRARQTDKSQLQGQINRIRTQIDSHPRLSDPDKATLTATVRQLETHLRTCKLLP